MAEIMVVLFIMTIILAAFAPLMTVRAKSTSRTSPWNWASPDSANTYFGVHPNQRVMIGQKTKGDDIDNKLTINASGSQSHMLFKKDGTAIAQMYLDEKGNYFIAADASLAPSGNYNIALGSVALQANTSGSYNFAIGHQVLSSNASGNRNVALGYNVLHKNLSGHGNIGFGTNILNNNLAGSYNLGLGTDTLQANTSGSYNLALGYQALGSNTSGNRNSALGYYALSNNTSGAGNTALGGYALSNNTSGYYNTAVGYASCTGVGSHRTTCLGAYSGPNNTDTNNNFVYIGNQYSKVYVYGTTELKTLIASSDARLKNIQGDYTTGLEQLKKIKPVQFTFKDDKKKTPRVGVIAQDLQKVFPKAVMKGDDGFLKIRQEDMFYAMLNAIKELAHRDDIKDKKIKELEARIQQLEKLYQPEK